MATAQVTPDNNTVTAEIFIAAPPDRVFQAITDPAKTRQWWGQKDLYRVTESHSDPRPGGKWSSVGVGADGTNFKVEGEYLQVEPPRLLVYTWVASYSGPMKTTVRWELEPRDVHGLHEGGQHRVGMGTMVKLRHDGFAENVGAAKSHGDGWIRVLGWLQAFAETGATVDTR